MSKKINKLYQHAGKCDDQQQLKDILGAAMVSTTKVFTDNSAIFLMTLTQLKKPGARKSLCPFTKIIYVKNRTTIRRVGAPRSKQKTIKAGTTM